MTSNPVRSEAEAQDPAPRQRDPALARRAPDRRPMSLTWRLFLCVSGLNILTMVIVGILGLHSANINISEDYDAQLITEASILWEILEEDSKDGRMSAFQIETFDAEHTAELLESVEQDSMLDYAQWRAFQVWHGGKLVMHSDNADVFPPAPLPHGFSNLTVGGDTWRAFSIHDKANGLVVTTFENLRDREIMERDILLDILVPLLIALPVLGIIFSIGIGFGLKGLHQLAGKLATRSPSDLSYLESGDLPKELKPLASSVNTLLSKLESALEHEREFIDHAAHELRTPLSALKLQAQLLSKSVKDTAAGDLMSELLASVDRTSRLVDQLLLMSRVSNQKIVLEKVVVHDVVKEALGMVATRIVDKDLRLNFHGDERMAVQAQPELLRTLVGTILDNAIKYTPRGGAIDIGVGDGAITVTDSGEGIPEAERGKVFDRFYRISGSKQPGSGLGLAIASQIAELLGAVITMETPKDHKGLRVVIRFG